MNSGKILLGVLAGISVGAALGILFAPNKGSVTRDRIYKKGEDYWEDVKDRYNDYIEDMKHKAESLKENGRAVVDKGKAKYEEAKREVKNSAS